MDPKWCQKWVATADAARARKGLQKTIKSHPAASKMDARWNHKLRKSVSAPKYVMCVWHNKNCGQLHIPLPGLPENTARKIPRNRCPPSSRHNTHKIIKLSKMCRKPSHFAVQLDVHLLHFSYLFPESGPKCPKGAQVEPKDTTMEPQGNSKPTKSRPNVLQG